MTLIITQRERRNLNFLFLYFGFALLCLASRTPDLKRSLGVNNGAFGVLLSLGALGAPIAFMWVGQISHRLGVAPVLIVTSALVYGPIALMPHIHTLWKFVLVNMLLGAGLNGFNIAVHHQALNRQLLSGEKSIPRLHGMFSLGTLLTTVLSIAITSHVSLAWHVDILMSLLWAGTLVAIFRMRQFLSPGSPNNEVEERVRVRDTWAMLTTNHYMGIAFLCAVIVEFSTNDWVTLSSHQDIKAGTTLSIVPYLAFLFGMTTGRLGIHKLLVFKPDTYWIRVSSRIGGVGFVIFLLLAKYLSSHSFVWAFTCEILGFLIGGLCGSFFAGLLTQISSQRSNFPGGVVVAQIGLAVAILTLLVKLVVSWVAQTTSITYALMIPGALMIALSFFKKLGVREVRV